MIAPVTTTVTVERPTETEPYETPTWATVADSVPGHISAPSGGDRRAGGDQETVDAVLLCEAGTTIAQGDRVTDDDLDETYHVTWVQRRRGLGLDHVKAGLRRITGTVPA